MSDSVLNTIKKLVGVPDDSFTEDILVHINSSFFTLYQLGVFDEPPIIKSEAETWGEVIGDDKNLEAIKTYIYIKVRLIFDPPATSFVIDALKKQAEEIEWRLNVDKSKGLVDV